MIGAILLSLKHNKKVKRQSLFTQITSPSHISSGGKSVGGGSPTDFPSSGGKPKPVGGGSPTDFKINESSPCLPTVKGYFFSTPTHEEWVGTQILVKQVRD
jgi:hypothetical protein